MKTAAKKDPVLVPRKLQAKYKHATDIDHTLPVNYSPTNAAAFGQAIKDLVSNEAVVAREVTYRGHKALLSIDARTGRMVLQYLDGRFWSAWALSPEQMKYVIVHGILP